MKLTGNPQISIQKIFSKIYIIIKQSKVEDRDKFKNRKRKIKFSHIMKPTQVNQWISQLKPCWPKESRWYIQCVGKENTKTKPTKQEYFTQQNSLSEMKIETFLKKQNLKEFITIRPAQWDTKSSSSFFFFFNNNRRLSYFMFNNGCIFQMENQ